MLRTLLVVLVALLLGVAGCDSDDDILDADTLTVGPSGSADFPSIQSAVESAKVGATIMVEAGTYVEEVVIEQSVTLLGAGAGSIVKFPTDSGTQDAVIEVRDAVGVHIEGFRVLGPDDGIQVRDSSEVVIASVVASGNGDEGVDVRNSSDVEISGIFEDNGDQGIHVRGESDRVLIHSSTITGSVQDGVKIELSTAVTVDSSTVSGNGQDGVKIESSADCTLSDSVVTNNGDDGVLVGESTGTQLLENEITDNLDKGIHLRASPDTLLEGNTVLGNAGGEIEID